MENDFLSEFILNTEKLSMLDEKKKKKTKKKQNLKKE